MTPGAFDAAADEIAAELIAMAAESEDGLAFLDRIMDQLGQARYIDANPLRVV